ncbi:TolC family protein [Stieleria varia]|uniref:Outer membrane efflux protein n=1 Tax=Stieleria varia TaxID=2528005 RepID=A0A5C6ARA0_9BACT|nr:TolC family protein [Stieleria varia]TWU02485.1 Outer membrane efflux protein [Stieleria varia]
MPHRILLIGLLGCIGCAGTPRSVTHSSDAHSAPTTAPAPPAEPATSSAVVEPRVASAPSASRPSVVSRDAEVRPVGYRLPSKTDVSKATDDPRNEPASGVLSINGRSYTVQLTEQTESSEPQPLLGKLASYQEDPLELVDPSGESSLSQLLADGPMAEVDMPHAAMPLAPETIDLNLPSALAMVGSDHPAVGLAQWRVQEAYARLDQARVMWLPSIQTGFSFHKHDGNYQASDGRIVDVNRNSFQYGLGAGATGAGTTPRPGIVARFHLADAIFQPQALRTTAWARSHAARGVINTQLLRVAQDYTSLVAAHQEISILQESRSRTEQLRELTQDFAEAGEGLRADAERMRTEVALLDTRMMESRERAAVASARLAESLSLDGDFEIVPLDVAAIPIGMVALETDKSSLVATALVTRPELKESQALVAAACEAFRREKFAPLVPSVVLGFSTGGFGGGLGTQLDDVDGRYDLDAMMSWEIRNLGMGENAARRIASSRVQQAKFEKLRVMDSVAREVTEAYKLVQLREQRIQIAQQGIQSAEDSHRRNLERIKDGQGLPLEALLSVQALERSRLNYLQAVVDHNQSQFQLQWALGWPVSSAIPPQE